MLLLYVDDILVTGDSTTYLEWFIAQLSREFSMKDLDQLHYFLGIEVSDFDHMMLISSTNKLCRGPS